MTDWQAVRTGTRIWRNIVVTLCLLYFSLFVLQVLASFELAVARGQHRPPADWAMRARLFMGVAFFSVTLITDALALRIARCWRTVPDPLRRRAGIFGAAAVVALGLNLGAGVMLLVDREAGGASALLGFSVIVGWIKMSAALSMHRGCLDALDCRHGWMATLLNVSILGLLVMPRLIDPIAIASLWAGIAFVVLVPLTWLIAFVVFTQRAQRAYGAAVTPAADTFD